MTSLYTATPPLYCINLIETMAGRGGAVTFFFMKRMYIILFEQVRGGAAAADSLT